MEDRSNNIKIFKERNSLEIQNHKIKTLNYVALRSSKDGRLKKNILEEFTTTQLKVQKDLKK